MAVDEKGLADLAILLDSIGKKVNETAVKMKVLTAMAEPVVHEAKRMAGRGGGVFPGASGRVADAIRAEWKPENPDEIRVGWGEPGFYGSFWERGFIHAGSKQFLKRPHIRPAYEAKKKEAVDAAINELRKEI